MRTVVIHRAGRDSESLQFSRDGIQVKTITKPAADRSGCGCSGAAATADDGEVGRPTSNPKTERADLRLTPAQKKKYLRLGGTAWVVKMLGRA